MTDRGTSISSPYLPKPCFSGLPLNALSCGRWGIDRGGATPHMADGKGLKLNKKGHRAPTNRQLGEALEGLHNRLVGLSVTVEAEIRRIKNLIDLIVKDVQTLSGNQNSVYYRTWQIMKANRDAGVLTYGPTNDGDTELPHIRVDEDEPEWPGEPEPDEESDPEDIPLD